MTAGSVLIADDEETFRESTCRLLRREGFDCDCAGDADAAIESLRHSHYDVLVSDIRMPCNPDLRLVTEARDWTATCPSSWSPATRRRRPPSAASTWRSTPT